MRKAILLALALILTATIAGAQYYLRPNLPPQSVIGNPYSINAPAQAIPFATLQTALSGSLLTTTLPSTIDLNNLPPQTVLGNATSSPAALGLVTFSGLASFKNSETNFPPTIYNTYDPTNVPGLTLIGNLSSTSSALALPVSIGNVLSVCHTPPLTGLSLGDGCSLFVLTNHIIG